ncbi:hypothetical protein IQ260_14600 [Leptolyngbya cf. ectocarpi LEGE 11479]|uniref:Uncharacterized protein n=1 Tax=Leptolyngbya cf. ectocarpi LEGE 11479 TaxID=1828722 RepID=A0A929F6V8_LEPEC|nr:element excision factor XisH family protein [Leptolyngbya ectocarpi]MBE9067881.1 hypothetical protein [Leptolyngbya cf. ectocarpi LEGE 11479]
MAKDTFHNVVRTALLKEQWKITHDPLDLKAGGVDLTSQKQLSKIILSSF